ncbi:MAG: SDR family NAD(P)-dependent oxidoreductase, partial [Planctomycetota bacterium]
MSERPLALITGGAKRVGRAIALELARAGCDLHVTYRASEREARTLADESSALGASVRLDALDLEDTAGTDAWARSLADGLDRLDVLVHNASVYEPCALEEVSP